MSTRDVLGLLALTAGVLGSAIVGIATIAIVVVVLVMVMRTWR